MEASQQNEFYEEKARAFFESLRQPFAEALLAARRNYESLLRRLVWLSVWVWFLSLPFAWAKTSDLLFNAHSFIFFNRTIQVTDVAGQILFACFLFLGALVAIARPIVRGVRLSKVHKILAARYMPFALSYSIAGELDEFQRHKMVHHQKTAVEQWTMLLKYLRWAFDSLNTAEETFHKLPASPEYPVAPHAKAFAEELNWKNVQKSTYAIVIALNSIHQKVSPRLTKGYDITAVGSLFRHLANFFYSSLHENRDDYSLACWAYAELTRAADALNSLPNLSESPQESKTQFFKKLLVASGGVFSHRSVVVAFIAWWVVIQVLCLLVSVVAFHLYPKISMDSAALVTLIATPVLAAGAMVGVSRRRS